MASDFLLGQGETLQLAMSRFQKFREIRDSPVQKHWVWNIDPEEVSIDVGFDILSQTIIDDKSHKIHIQRSLWIGPDQVAQESQQGTNQLEMYTNEATEENAAEFDADNHLNLSEEQMRAVMQIKDSTSHIIRLTGKAGTGKSAILRWFKRWTNASILATTGRAALNIGGTTVDRFFGFRRPQKPKKGEKRFVGKEDSDEYQGYYTLNTKKLAISMYESSHLLFVDEGSMVGKNMAYLIIAICRAYGKKLVLVGDWAQAAPVDDDWITKCHIFSNKFGKMNHETIRLTEIHRQSEAEYLGALDAARTGFANGESDIALFEKIFRPRVGPPPAHDLGIRIFARKDKVRQYNDDRIGELMRATKGQILNINTEFHDFRLPKKKSDFPIEEKDIRRMEEGAMMTASNGDGARLAIGCKVLVTKNSFYPGEFVNGQTGVLTGIYFRKLFSSTNPPPSLDYVGYEDDMRGHSSLEREEAVRKGSVHSVGFVARDPAKINEMIRQGHDVGALEVTDDETGQILLITRLVVGEEKSRRASSGQMKAKDQYHYCMIGFPLVLGYAFTVHKAQGLSVNHAWVDVLDIETFPNKHGLFYVAISRTRTLSGLILSKYSEHAVHVDSEMRDFI